MANDLLQTKLYIPPLRPFFVPRPHLIQQFNQGLKQGCKLVLISAPAGFGKTTLVSEWVNNLRLTSESEGPITYKTAWLSLDEGDNDLTRFLAYLIAALNQAEGIDTTIGEGALNMLQSPQPPPTEAILISLINEIAAIKGEVVFVIDDYHLIDAQPIYDVLTFFLEHLPLQMHLVIATRDDPNLPLARLRARGQLTELRAADLRFNISEATEFLNRVMGLNLVIGDINALEKRTEGWITGLQLAALALQGPISMQGQQDTANLIKSFTGSHRFVLDYLIEEVLEQQSESVQMFLLKTAVLDRLTGSLCDALTGQNDGQETLLMLEHANLFIIPLDQERRWYRYHHLFADLLYQRLVSDQSEKLPILHQKTSEWYEQNGFIDDAIEHALRGENFERAACLIEDQYGIDYEEGDQPKVRLWLAKLPEELVSSKPRLCLLSAWNQFNIGQLEAAEQSLQIAEKLFGSITDQDPDSLQNKEQVSDPHKVKLIGRIAVIRSFIASFRGYTPKVIEYARHALELLPEEELLWRSAALIALGGAYASEGQMTEAKKARLDALETSKASGDIYILMIVNLSLAEILREQGKLQQVIDSCERQLKRATESGISESSLVGWLYGLWGEALAELNQLDEALEKAKKGAKLAVLGRDIMHIASSNLCLVRVLFSSGDFTGAENIIQSMENSAREYDLPLHSSLQFSAWQARIWLVQEKIEDALNWIETHKLESSIEPTYLHEMENIVFARILIAQGRTGEATALLERLLKAAEAGGRTSRVIEILILQTFGAQSDDIPQAMSSLEQALHLAEEGGYIRIFIDEGPPMASLLYEALSRGICPDYVSRLLAVFPVTEPKQAASTQKVVVKSELIEPLSEREIEVLQLMAEGLTNPEIATKLYLSPNTIKVHTRNIYGKLGVNNRTQAVMRSKGIGILPAD